MTCSADEKVPSTTKLKKRNTLLKAYKKVKSHLNRKINVKFD